MLGISIVIIFTESTFTYLYAYEIFYKVLQFNTKSEQIRTFLLMLQAVNTKCINVCVYICVCLCLCLCVYTFYVYIDRYKLSTPLTLFVYASTFRDRLIFRHPLNNYGVINGSFFKFIFQNCI